MEFWKPVVGYEGLYEVSDHGHVRNANGKILRCTQLNGYSRVYLYREGKRKCFFIHRIVAYAFLGKPEDDHFQINHKDGSKGNNCVSNLEWCTASENVAHSFRIGLREINKRHLLEANCKPIMQYSANGKCIRKWESMSEAARQMKLNVSNISNCCKGRIKSTGGYIWRICSGS